VRPPRRHLLLLLPFAVALLAGCGSSSGESSRPAPSADEFPSAKGKTIASLLQDSGAKPAKLVIAPATSASLSLGHNRYAFGVFTKGREQVTDADVALYFAKSEGSPVEGPYPAKLSSLEVKPAYRSQLNDPDAAQAVYVVPRVDFDKKGPWVAIAMLKGKGGLEASRVPSPVIEQYPRIPKVGEKATLIHTPTAADVGGDLAKIDTRIPPDQMHKVDFADVVGKQPIVLVFATPALCQSRVCGPVVDVAQQVADEYKGKADFIHMEIWENNEIGTPRPQVRAYHLETEPWTFLIDRNGVIRDRIEGAYGVSELEQAMRTIVPS
jgi:hypothetical protein